MLGKFAVEGVEDDFDERRLDMAFLLYTSGFKGKKTVDKFCEGKPSVVPSERVHSANAAITHSLYQFGAAQPARTRSAIPTKITAFAPRKIGASVRKSNCCCTPVSTYSLMEFIDGPSPLEAA
jgi:hypothetical protein